MPPPAAAVAASHHNPLAPESPPAAVDGPATAPAPANHAHTPRHVAIIMDGNGRWAQQRGLPRIEGHRRGVETVRRVIDSSRELGVRMLTLYAFSAENWLRPQDEVGALMRLLERYLARELKTFVKNRIRLRTIGRTHELPAGARRQLARTIEATQDFEDYTLTLALNYGSRSEVVDAARAYAATLATGALAPDDHSWESFARHLYTADLPDPDLVIRTSGETRLSNFLLLQAAYAEFVFTPVLWPDFSKNDLALALAEYGRRERRYGKTSAQCPRPISPLAPYDKTHP